MNQGLAVRGVSHRFGGIVAADRVDLRVQPGDVHCLLGPSGSGKSTLLRLIAGLETLQNGRIEIGGVEVAGPGVHRHPEERSIGFVFQDFALFPHLDVRRNVRFGMARRAGDRPLARADELLEQVGMSGYADAMPHTLSGGQQQRVALARALAREPLVMLLDEPFSGLDARLREAVRTTTLEVLHRAGVATLMVTHDPDEALVAGDVISVIDAGRLLQTGTADDVYRRSESREVAEAFGTVNRFAGTVFDGSVATVCGPVEASGLTDGTPVEVLVRPESLCLQRESSNGAVAARVASVVREGGMVRLDLVLNDGTRLTARDLVRRMPRVHDERFVAIAEGAARVLPG